VRLLKTAALACSRSGRRSTDLVLGRLVFGRDFLFMTGGLQATGQFARGLRFIFLLLLALTLFGGEIGESARLMDDTSNDFVQAPSSLDKAPVNAIVKISAAVTEESVATVELSSYREPAAFFSGPDLLQLLSVQRT
jgi:hypothetical protein